MTKSTNGGKTRVWVIELGNAVSVRDVKVDTTTNRDIVLVATNNGGRSAPPTKDYLTHTRCRTFDGLSVWSIVRSSAERLCPPSSAPQASMACDAG